MWAWIVGITAPLAYFFDSSEKRSFFAVHALATTKSYSYPPRRMRDEAKHRERYRVEAKLPVDILGIYIYLPKANS